MKILLDEMKCVGHGCCEATLSSVFEVNDEGFVTVHHDAVADADPAQLRAAVAACPSEALTTED